MLPPGASVVAGFALLYFAVHSPAPLVVDDYARIEEISREQWQADERAADRGLVATLRLNADERGATHFAVEVAGDVGTPPSTLELKLRHAGNAAADRALVLALRRPRVRRPHRSCRRPLRLRARAERPRVAARGRRRPRADDGPRRRGRRSDGRGELFPLRRTCPRGGGFLAARAGAAATRVLPRLPRRRDADRAARPRAVLRLPDRAERATEETARWTRARGPSAIDPKSPRASRHARPRDAASCAAAWTASRARRASGCSSAACAASKA